MAMTSQNNGAPSSGEPSRSSGDRSVVAVILAAGRSTRMESDLVKVLHEVAGRPMIAWVVDACREAGCGRQYVVVGHQAAAVRSYFGGRDYLRFVQQDQQLGTGHAVQQVEPELEGFQGDVLLLAGDGPLIRSATLIRLLDHHRKTGAAATLATARIDDPAGYGRIVRDGTGRFRRIVEEKDATLQERAICEINPSYYCFRAGPLFAALQQVSNDNARGEYYLTDVLEILGDKGDRVEIMAQVDPSEVHSINTPEQLAQVAAILESRHGRQEALR